MIYVGNYQEIEQVLPLKIGVIAEKMSISHFYLREIESQEDVLFKVRSRLICRDCEYVLIPANEGSRGMVLDQLIIVNNGEWCSSELFHNVLEPLIRTVVPPEYKYLWVQFAEI